MRVPAVLFLFVFLTAAAQAQQAPAGDVPPGVSVLKCGWSKELIPGWENRVSGAEPYEVMLARLANEQQLQRARNTGNKAAVVRSEKEAKLYENASKGKDTKPEARQRYGYRYKISVMNGGQKAIKAIDWDYVFLDSVTQNEIERHQFTSEERIRPGKQKELSVFNLAPPTRTVSADALSKRAPSPFIERVTLVRVEYEDGTVWQNH